MELEELKSYIRVDYDDDDEIIKLMIDAVLDEMEELIPKFDRTKPTSRQKLLIYAYVKELYDKRGNTVDADEKQQKAEIRFTVQSMMLKEMLR